MVTSRPAASYRPLSLATKNPRWLPLGVQSSATVIFDDMSWSGAARSGAADNHDVVTVVDDILKRFLGFLGATPKPRRTASRRRGPWRTNVSTPQHADFSTPPRKRRLRPRASSSPPPAPDATRVSDVDACRRAP